MGRILDQDDIMADPVKISSFGKDTHMQDGAKILKGAFDQIWREFNFPRSFNCDPDGNWSART
jgi:hypothetical protein